MGASFDLGQPFTRQKSWGLGWGKNRLSHYNIHTEGALPPSVTVITRLKHLDYWICYVSLTRINSKIEICVLWIFNEGDYSANFEWMFLKH